jgi:flagellin-like hook-associated protein FlgL
LRQTSDPSLKRQKPANSARDKRVSVTAADLAVRIRDLSAMIEKLAMAINAIQAADHSISAITELVRLAQALVRRAQETTDVTVRATLAGQFDALLPEIDLLAGRANVNGINLLGGNDLTISRSEDARAAVTVASFKAAANDLAIKPSQKNWATIAGIDLAAAEVKLATVVLRS